MTLRNNFVQQNKVPSTSRTFSKVRLIPTTGSLGPDQLFALDLTSTLRGHDRQKTATSGLSDWLLKKIAMACLMASPILDSETPRCS